MALNPLWNKRSGPGGGTRRLHHFCDRVPRVWGLPARYGDEIGSTRVVKTLVVLGMVPAVIGLNLISANDNVELTAAAA